MLSRSMAATILVLLWLLAPTLASAEEKEKMLSSEDVELLFVQSGTSGSFDGKRLTLKGVGSTILFTDRPARLDGQMHTAKFVKAWDEGPDSFSDDPPNAVLSILAEDGATDAVVELTDPRLDGTTVSYAAKVSDGKIPASFGTASLFIDHGAGGYVAAALGGAMLGHSLTQANMNAQYAREQSAGYSYRTAAPAPCQCECR